MYPKLLALILFVALMAMGTLVIRQQRLEAMHQIVRTHAQINQDRQAIWDYQVRIASRLDPETLGKAAERQGLRLRPMVDAPVVPDTVENLEHVDPEDGRFVNQPQDQPRQQTQEVLMVKVAPGPGQGQTPILIPVVDPEPNTRSARPAANRR